MPNTPRMVPAQNPPQGWQQPQQPQQPQQGWPQLPQGWPPKGQLRKSRGKLVAAIAVLVIGVGVLLTVPGYCTRREIRAYRAELAVRADIVKRWKSILTAGTCYRRSDGTRWYGAIDQTAAGKSDALHDVTSHSELVMKSCTTALKSLEGDPDLPDNVHAVVHEWLAADKPLAKLDDGPPDEVKAALLARDKVRERVRTEVLPAVRDRIRKVQDMNAKKKNYIWWRLELGLQLENILDLGYATHRANGDIVAVLAVPLKSYIDQMYEADKAVGVHVMQSLTVLSHSDPKDAWGNLLNVEDNGAWTNIEDDNSVFGPMPPEPQGCDIDILDVTSSANLR